MNIDPFILWTLKHSSVSNLMNIIEVFSEIDRYQASIGIQQAARIVADTARKAGVPLVEIHNFTADNKQQWWSFCAPLSWTPMHAKLTVPGKPEFNVDHSMLPFALATYSRGASGKKYRLCTPQQDTFTPEDLVIIPAADFFHRNWQSYLCECGAAGFVTDAFARYDEYTKSYYRGRIELTPGTQLFAFSLLPAELMSLQATLPTINHAEVEILIDTTADMPVVSACLPGVEPQHEIWLTAHLCHARAGANDNASGVSVLLEAARLIAQLQAQKTIPQLRYALRFVSGPEFTGVAALQHQLSHLPAPLAVINLDMVGEDQALCESPFCIERPPEEFDGTLVQLTEALTEAVFEHTASVGGRWLTIPFQGFSDHALFMTHGDNRRNAPAIQIGHIDDRFNHCAADTPDKVSPLELQRTLAVVVPLILQLQRHTPQQLAPIQHITSPREASGLHWSGPLNLRAFIETLPESIRIPLQQRISRNKMYLALLHNCLIGADTRPWQHIFTEVCNSLCLPADDDLQALFNALFPPPPTY
ncbi:DUF4910 domain-containing protein [Pectobacterium polaris]|uniref:DUF4910 domain-containing protein n=1 Tax=Pectobacterium polaris TaxID=2042057 RepID=UPI0023AF9040|nr:DUF4910 domain-containing protein [Pectobacterium polaris]MDE8755254.1 DUF4910 domain-containing protein [Pectobacterium polaris]